MPCVAQIRRDPPRHLAQLAVAQGAAVVGRDDEGLVRIARGGAFDPVAQQLWSGLLQVPLLTPAIDRPHAEERCQRVRAKRGAMINSATRLEHRKSGLPDLRTICSDLGQTRDRPAAPSFPPSLAGRAKAGKSGAPKRVSAEAGETPPSAAPQDEGGESSSQASRHYTSKSKQWRNLAARVPDAVQREPHKRVHARLRRAMARTVHR